MSNIQPLPFNRSSMLDYIDSTGEPFDVVVIGGGATGLYTALDAAARGLRTAVFERNDFASGPSSRSTKLIHGGVRYMQQGRFGLVRESLKERRMFMDNAPHLVRKLAVLVPAFSRWQQVKYLAGVKSYGAISRGYGLGPTRRVGADGAVEAVPGISREHLRGGAVYLDGQTDDARLALSIARTAADHGAAVLNYAPVTALRTESGMVRGVEFDDVVGSERFSIDARVVINATGIFTDETLSLDPSGRNGMMRWSRGTHILLPGAVLGGNIGLLIPKTSDGRVVFALPWLGATLVGTTDVAVTSPHADPEPPKEDVEFLLAEIDRYIPGAGSASVLSASTGIRPLVSSGGSSSTPRISRSHRVIVSDAGLVTVTGGKWTTARLMAQHALERAIEVAGLPASRTPTIALRLHGYEDGPPPGELEDQPLKADTLYGRDAAEITRLEARDPGLKSPVTAGLPYRLSHAVYAVRDEMVVTLDDVLARRTRTLLLDRDATLNAAPSVAETLERTCSLPAGWADEQIALLPGIAEQYGSRQG